MSRKLMTEKITLDEVFGEKIESDFDRDEFRLLLVWRGTEIELNDLYLCLKFFSLGFLETNFNKSTWKRIFRFCKALFNKFNFSEMKSKCVKENCIKGIADKFQHETQ